MRIQVQKQFISGFLLALFISFYLNITQFSHVHVIDGATIVHSHVHHESHHNSQSGGHSGTELTLIDRVSQFETLAPVFPSSISKPECEGATILSTVIFRKPDTGFVNFFFLRAPPAA